MICLYSIFVEMIIKYTMIITFLVPSEVPLWYKTMLPLQTPLFYWPFSQQKYLAFNKMSKIANLTCKIMRKFLFPTYISFYLPSRNLRQSMLFPLRLYSLYHINLFLNFNQILKCDIFIALYILSQCYWNWIIYLASMIQFSL